jgi:hypothetical protein
MQAVEDCRRQAGYQLAATTRASKSGRADYSAPRLYRAAAADRRVLERTCCLFPLIPLARSDQPSAARAA